MVNASPLLHQVQDHDHLINTSQAQAELQAQELGLRSNLGETGVLSMSPRLITWMTAIGMTLCVKIARFYGL